MNGTTHSAARSNRAAFIGPPGAATVSTGDTSLIDNAFRAVLDLLESPLYNCAYSKTSIGLLSVLQMSGNLP